MTDIVEQLKELARAEHDDLSVGKEAAEEIESLRSRLSDCTLARERLEAELNAVRAYRETRHE